MADYCELAPKVHKRNGVKIEEKESKLFADIKEAVQDYNTAWDLWALTKTKSFKEMYNNKVEYDELGEVTFPSLIKVLDLEDSYNDSKSEIRVAKDYGFANKTFNSPLSIIDRVNEFNSKEKRHIAVLRKEGDKYRVDIFKRNPSSIEAARTQSYNHALTGEIAKILRTLGFDFEVVEGAEFEGLFDPTDTKLHDGLLTIIKIAKGEIGERALPEEFAHLIIEGLHEHPLVKRLLASLSQEQILETLGDDYSTYAEKYDNNEERLKKEAAGKLLADYINNKGTLQKPTTKEKRGLLSRVWNWAKNLFSKITNNNIEAAKIRAYNATADIYNLIATGEVIPLVDKYKVLSAEKLYKVSPKYEDFSGQYESLEHVSKHAIDITARMLQKEKRDSLKNTATKETTQSLQRIREADEADNYYNSLSFFLQDVDRQILLIERNKKNAIENEKSGELTEIQTINEVAKIIRNIREIIDGYSPIIKAIASFDKDEVMTKLGLDEEKVAGSKLEKDGSESLSNHARKVLTSLNDLEQWTARTRINILYRASRTVYKHDQLRGIGSERNEVMALQTILDHGSRDINFIDRYFSAMSDADDPLLVIMDGIVKNQKYRRDMEVQELYNRLAVLDKKLIDAGYTTEFMYEKDSKGVPTGRILSIYDFATFNKERTEKIKELRSQNLSDEKYFEALNRWKYGNDEITGEPRLIRVYVDPKWDDVYNNGNKDDIPADAIYEEMPNPRVYNKNANRIKDLSTQQRDYYNEVMQIKREMMLKIPHRGQYIYNCVYISKGFVEGIIDNSVGNPLKTTVENFKKQFLRKPDDIGFGTSENFAEDIEQILRTEKDSKAAAAAIIKTLADSVDPDIVAVIKVGTISNIIDKNKDDLKEATSKIIEAISMENFYIIDTDFANHRVQKLPVYYTRRLHDMKMLSTDFTGTLMAYSAMAINYDKMNEVVDILEVARDYINNDRPVRENEGGKSVISKFTALGKEYKSFVEKAGRGTNTANRTNDFMSSVVYEERKENEGVIPILKLDSAKTFDAIKNYSGLLNLGFNVFSTISNITVGKLQQWIEAVGGEYFNVKDYAKAVGQYTELVRGCFFEMGSTIKKNKLSLLIQMFDPMGDYFEKLRDPSFHKSAAARILGGNSMLAYIGMNAGEHMLRCQTMLAILNHIKLVNTKTNEKISLYDALKVVTDENGVTRLKLDDDLAYERDLIDYTVGNKGTPDANKNYGRPVRDENGKIKTELVPLEGNEYTQFIIDKKRMMKKVNDSLNGAFSEDEKGAAHRKAYWRLIMQFRQWMPAHYERRFARAHYDNDLQQWREGYYITVGKMINQMRKDLIKGELEFAKIKNQLSPHEIANVRRAFAEISMFMMLLSLVRMGGRVKDRDRSWLDKMVLYQLNRMYLEVGASMPGPGMFSNLFQLLQSPAASIDTFEKFNKVLKFWNMWDEIQTGRYQGWSEWERDAYNLVPAVGQISKAIAFDDSMFSMFEKDN